MEKLEMITTVRIYNKYRDMAEKAGISFSRNDKYFGYTKQELLALYIKDNYLNNISLESFDSMYRVLPAYTRGVITNLADNTCVWKHLLIYEVLGIAPIFVENGKNYKEWPPLKK